MLTPSPLWALAGVTLIGAILRLLPVSTADFPLNDGALFLSMSRDLAANGFVPPEAISYNDLAAPNAYPPLGIYLLGTLEALGLDGIDVLRWLPALFSIATIPVAYAIGLAVFGQRWRAVGAAAFFAVSTGSYEFLIQGGGITRAPGFLVALITVWLLLRAYRTPAVLTAAVAGAGAGVTALFHLQAAVFVAVTAVVLLPLVATSLRNGVRQLAIVGAASLVVVVPWVALVVARHGIEPYLSAAATAGMPIAGIFAVLVSRTSGGQFEVLGFATTLGLLVSGLRRFWLPLVWLLAIVVVDSRAGQPYIAVPAALAVAFMVGDLGAAIGGAWQRRSPGRRPAIVTPVIAVALLLFSAADSVAAQGTVDSPLRVIPEPERHAMAWVAENTAADASFVVVTGRYWAFDATAEWFPVVAGRESITTVQGYEWLGADTFRRQLNRSIALPNCVASADEACIGDWFETAGNVDYLLVAHSPVAEAAGFGCCLQLAQQIQRVREAQTVYQRDTVAIVRLRSAR